MIDSKTELLEKALKRERLARKEAERILEDKSLELFKANQNLSRILNEKEHELQNLFKTFLDPYVLIDLSGNVLKMNDASYNFFGVDIDKQPFNVIQSLHIDDKKHAFKSFEKLVTEGNFRNFQARVYNKHNELRWVDINSSIVFDTNGTPLFAQGVMRDITEEKIQEQKYNEQTKQLNTIVEHSSLGIVLTKDGRMLKTNNAFVRLIGYDEDELVGRHIKKIFEPYDFISCADDLDRINIGEIDNLLLRKRFIRKDQTKIWTKISVSAVRDEENDINYQVSLIEDITEKIKSEKLKELLLDNLKKSNKELNDFAHVVSHDLKSPLRSMNTLVNWLKEDCVSIKNEEVHTNFNLLLKKIDKMDHLINGILKYASVDKIQHPNKDIDVNIVIKEIVETIDVPKHITIKIERELPIIKADKFRLHQLFQNIISNAIKHIDKDIGIITIKHEEFKKFYEFSISDNGVGIPEKYHEKIFGIFQTLEEREGSTGVGLSIVKKIIAFYNGRIWLTSKEGEGTTFYFTIAKKWNNQV